MCIQSGLTLCDQFVDIANKKTCCYIAYEVCKKYSWARESGKRLIASCWDEEENGKAKTSTLWGTKYCFWKIKNWSCLFYHLILFEYLSLPLQGIVLIKDTKLVINFLFSFCLTWTILSGKQNCFWTNADTTDEREACDSQHEREDFP